MISLLLLMIVVTPCYYVCNLFINENLKRLSASVLERKMDRQSCDNVSSNKNLVSTS